MEVSLLLTDVLYDADALAAEVPELHGAVVLAHGPLPCFKFQIRSRT